MDVSEVQNQDMSCSLSPNEVVLSQPLPEAPPLNLTRLAAIQYRHKCSMCLYETSLVTFSGNHPSSWNKYQSSGIYLDSTHTASNPDD